MAHGYTEEQVRLATICHDLTRLNEQAGDLMNFVDFSDSVTFDREDGTTSSGIVFNAGMAYSQALQRPSATACAYIMEMQLRQLRARSRAFCILNPYWMAARENKISYVVGVGHIWSIMPRSKKKKVSDELREKCEGEIRQFSKINKYRRRQGEKLTRLDRDGEFFLRFFENRPDGILRVRFVEPLLVQDPPGYGPEGDIWFGIGFDGDYEEPVRYFIRPSTYDGGMTDQMTAMWRKGVPASEIQHRTVNVDLGSPRGLPTTYALQDACVQAVSTLKSMGRLVDIRARIALIRKQINGTVGQIQTLLLQNRQGVVSRGNQLRSAFQWPYGSVVDTNDQRSYEFPAQNVETDKIVHSLKADLQSVAAALGLADFTLSGDSAAAFSNALVKEGPMDRAIGRMQQDMIEDDIEVYERALKVAADNGRLPEDVLEQVKVDIDPPGVIARDRLVNTQSDEILWRCGALSSASMAMRSNLDPDEETARGAEPQLTKGNQTEEAPKDSTASGRGVPAGKEPGPGANRNTAKESLEESSHDPQSQDKLTAEDLAMGERILTPEWKSRTKQELRSLPNSDRSPREWGIKAEYEPGVQGVYLGMVDGQQVWSVDFDAMVIKYNCPDLVVAGNSMRWKFIPRDKAVIDWAYPIVDALHCALHELGEQLLEEAGWAYSRAHRYANRGPGMEMDFLLELRPELAVLKNQS